MEIFPTCHHPTFAAVPDNLCSFTFATVSQQTEEKGNLLFKLIEIRISLCDKDSCSIAIYGSGFKWNILREHLAKLSSLLPWIRQLSMAPSRYLKFDSSEKWEHLRPQSSFFIAVWLCASQVFHPEFSYTTYYICPRYVWKVFGISALIPVKSGDSCASIADPINSKI